MPTCSDVPIQEIKLQFNEHSGTFYIFSGNNFKNNYFSYFNSICSFSIKKLQWKLLTQTQSLSLTSGGSCLIDKTLYYFGGLDKSGKISYSIYSYNLSDNDG